MDPFPIKTIKKLWYSIAMLVYQRVCFGVVFEDGFWRKLWFFQAWMEDLKYDICTFGVDKGGVISLMMTEPEADSCWTHDDLATCNDMCLVTGV